MERTKENLEYGFNAKFSKFIISGTTQASIDKSCTDMKEEFKLPFHEIIDSRFEYSTIWIFKNSDDKIFGVPEYILKVKYDNKEKTRLKILLAGGYKNIFGKDFIMDTEKNMEKATIVIPILKESILKSWNTIFEMFEAKK